MYSMHLGNFKTKSLTDFVDALQSRGYYTFTRDEAQKSLGASNTAFTFAANRLSKKGKIASPRRGFYVIVPTEYRLSGAPPASWYIDDLMKFHETPYYVGLLSASALHGAAHQQPQEFQIITTVQLRPIRIGRDKIRFFTKKKIERTATVQIKSATGYFLASTPEATAFDLIRYLKPSGHLNHVATVLNELRERLSPSLLVTAAKAEGEVVLAQRLGYLLDFLKSGKLTNELHRWVKKKNPVQFRYSQREPSPASLKGTRGGGLLLIWISR
jgi:predicted transcriptional regulator of viral defense system